MINGELLEHRARLSAWPAHSAAVRAERRSVLQPAELPRGRVPRRRRKAEHRQPQLDATQVAQRRLPRRVGGGAGDADLEEERGVRADADAAVPRGARGGGGGDGGGAATAFSLSAVGRRRRPSIPVRRPPRLRFGRRLGRFGLLLQFDRAVLLRIDHRALSESLEELGAPCRTPLVRTRLEAAPQLIHFDQTAQGAHGGAALPGLHGGDAGGGRWRWHVVCGGGGGGGSGGPSPARESPSYREAAARTPPCAARAS